MTSPATDVFYRSLFENMIDGLAYCQMLFDEHQQPIDFQYIMVNKNFEHLTGLHDVVGKRVTTIIPEIRNSNPELFHICGQVALTGNGQQFETYIAPLDRWFFVSVYSPKRNFFVAVFQNITEQKQVAKSLENARIAARNVLEDLSVEKSRVDAARAKEEAILLSIGDGLVATDEKGTIALFNRAAEKLLGKKREEVLGKFFSKVLTIENEQGVVVDDARRPIRLALATGVTTTTTSATDSTYYYVRKDQTRFPVAMMVTPVLLDKRVIGTIEVFRDITQEKEVDKAKTEFVSLASHQLRTPLATVSWYTEMLLAGDVGKLNREQQKYLSQVYEGNQRLIRLVNALLNVSRIELGTFVIEPEPTNIVKLIQSVIDEQKPQIDQKKLRLISHFKAPIPLLQVDPNLLRIVVQNLLTNAIKYTPTKGTITVSLHGAADTIPFKTLGRRTETLAIVVSDTGYGIPKGQQNKIFTKLFRADNIRTKDSEGTGLGLYIVKSIIDHAGGQIWFSSEENRGTTFTVSLPLSGMKKQAGTKGLQ